MYIKIGGTCGVTGQHMGCNILSDIALEVDIRNLILENMLNRNYDKQKQKQNLLVH